MLVLACIKIWQRFLSKRDKLVLQKHSYFEPANKTLHIAPFLNFILRYLGTKAWSTKRGNHKENLVKIMQQSQKKFWKILEKAFIEETHWWKKQIETNISFQKTLTFSKDAEVHYNIKILERKTDNTTLKKCVILTELSGKQQELFETDSVELSFILFGIVISETPMMRANANISLDIASTKNSCLASSMNKSTISGKPWISKNKAGEKAKTLQNHYYLCKCSFWWCW